MTITQKTAIDLDMYLSEHFQLKELLRTSHRKIDNTPTSEVVSQLKFLCENFLEPIRIKFGPIWISSGYRCPILNKTIGGAKDSAHLYGCAADLNATRKGVTVTQIVKWIKEESGLEYDQIIDEGTPTSAWVHMGILRPNHEKSPRKQALKMRNGIYTQF